MVLDKSHWESNHSKLTRVVELLKDPPPVKPLGQIARENGLGADGEQMCRLLVSGGYTTEQQLQAYRKRLRSQQS